jgi:predicted ArsR family transcriptional regulator
MEEQSNPATEIFRKKFETFKNLANQMGEKKAWEKMFEGYPEKHKKNMGQFIENDTLATAFTKAIPAFKKSGWDMEVVDISSKGMDAVIEIQKVCPALSVSKELGYEKPCFLVCEMDGEATTRVFAEMKGDILCRQADGACVCAFKYERKAKKT